MIFDPNINTCIIPSYASMRTLAYYSHLIPVFIMILLGILVLVKSKKDLFSKVFLSFIVVFSLWLIGDLITWTSGNYYLIYTVWSVLVCLEIIFYILGLYFTMVFNRKADIKIWQKILLFLPILIPIFITITGNSVVGFNYPVCLAFNNTFLDKYKLYLEIIILVVIFIFMLIPFFKKMVANSKKSHIIVLGSMFFFLSVFGITEYLGSYTSDYTYNLYSLFLLPVFLIAIIYAVFELDIFNVKMLGTYYLVFGLVVLMSVQLFFTNGVTDRFLTIFTVAMTVGLSIILFRNLKRESDQRIQIEKLNVDLEKLIQQRESLVHLITHKVKGSFTHSKYIFAGLIDGMFGVITPETKKIAQFGIDSDDAGIKTVDLILNASNLQKGTVKFDLKPVSFKEILLKTIEEKKEAIQQKGLGLEINIGEDDYKINGDVFWLKEVSNNLIDNALYYTKTGKIIIGLEKKIDKVLFSVKDTGVGVTPEDRKNLFTEGGRGQDSVKTNVNSTGYGLYSVKLIVEAHGGKVWMESEGKDKGSQFFVEFKGI